MQIPHTHSNFATRRQFLVSSSAAVASLFCIPTSVFADSGSDVVLRAAVLSDVHYPGRSNAPEVARFEAGLQFMYEYSQTQSYPRFDALLVGGDMSNNGKENQIKPFCQSMDKYLKPETKRVLCMGNHDHWGGNRPLWERIFSTPANLRQEINGFQFITLSPEKGSMRNGDYKYALDWLKTELDAAAAADKDKPIFLIQHYPITNTVYGSCPPDNWGINDLCELLDKYPRVIDFSGHSHYPINDPRSAWQGTYTAFGTGTLSYFEMSGGVYNRFPAGHRNAAQFYIMEIHRDNSVVLKLYDIITQSFFNCVYLVASPGNVDKYIYTNKRIEPSKAPVWAKDATVTVENLNPSGAMFQFPQAQFDGQENIVHSYKIEIDRKIPSQTAEPSWVNAVTRYEWSEYYFNNMPKSINITIDSLEDEADYRMRITALNCFGKTSDTTLDTVFSTPKDPNSIVDKKADFPQANILDVHFTADGAVNTATNSLPQQKPVLTLGQPQLVTDAALGCTVAQLDGTKDAFKVNFSAQEYSRMTRSITMAAQFKIDQFTSHNMDVFANTEVGGYCLEINRKTKQLEFWCHIAGSYRIVRAPISTGEYITAFGVYDGTHVLLYINGKEAAREAASGAINYTHTEAARAFCIGSDITRNGGGEGFLKGNLAKAQIFNWALSPKQIQNLSK